MITGRYSMSALISDVHHKIHVGSSENKVNVISSRPSQTMAYEFARGGGNTQKSRRWERSEELSYKDWDRKWKS